MEEPGTGSLPHPSWVGGVFVGKVIRQRTHFLQSTGALIVSKVQIGIHTPKQTIALTLVGRVVAKRKIPEPRLHTEVLKVVSHVITRHFANIKIKANEALGPPHQLLILLFHQIATVHESGIKRATLLGNVVDKINLGQANPGSLNHFFAKFAILGERARLRGAREAEVAKDGVGHDLSFHTFIIAQNGPRAKPGNPSV